MGPSRKGFYTLSRELLDWPVGKDFCVRPRDTMADIVAWAACADGQRVNGIKLNRGEVLLSTRYCEQAWGWSRNRVIRHLRRLQQRDTLRTIRETRHGTVYVLVNYEVWHTGGTTNGTTTGTTFGTTNGTTGDDKEEGKKKGKRRGESHQTWLTPFWDLWIARFGPASKPPAGKMAKTLKPLVDLHGTEDVEQRWKYFLAQQDPQYLSVPRFGEMYGVWSEDAKGGKLTRDEEEELAYKAASI